MAKGFTVQTREIVQQRATENGLTRCERCGHAAQDLQYHHRRPRGMGGSKRAATNQASNCLLLCGECHLHVEAHRFAAIRYGHLVLQTKDPLATPVLCRGEWVLLDNDGHTYRIPTPAGGAVA